MFRVLTGSEFQPAGPATANDLSARSCFALIGGMSSNECPTGILCWTTIYRVNGDSTEAIKYCTAVAAAVAVAAERNQQSATARLM